MVAIEEHEILREPMSGSVTEGVRAPLEAARHQYRVVGHLPEREYGRAAGQDGDLVLQVAIATLDLVGRRMVSGRQAFDGVGDATTIELETVLPADRHRPRRKSEA